MKSFFRYALMSLVLVVVALVSMITAMRFAIHGSEVAVPKFVGMGPVEAERAAASNGLMLTVENRFYSSEVPEGKIISQLPQPGSKVRRGWQVRVAQSLGPQRVVVPSLLGESARAAEINLRRRGLDLGTVGNVHLADTPVDQVVAQSPPPNATGISSPKISILIAAPPEQTAFVMPDFVGQQLADASRALEEAGFKLGNVTNTPRADTAVQPGGGTVSPAPIAVHPPSSALTTIVRQTPAAGSKVLPGTTVNFE